MFLKEIVGCEEVNATQCSHDQGIDFVGYKKYVPCLTANEQNSNLLYVIGQAKHYKNECVEVSEIRELAGAIYLLKTNDFSKKRAQIGERVIYRNQKCCNYSHRSTLKTKRTASQNLQL